MTSLYCTVNSFCEFWRRKNTVWYHCIFLLYDTGNSLFFLHILNKEHYSCIRIQRWVILMQWILVSVALKEWEVVFWCSVDIPGIHNVVRNDVLYETRMAIRQKTVMWTSYTETSYSEMMVEPLFWILESSRTKSFPPPNVNVNAIRCNWAVWAGLRKTTGGRTHESHLSLIQIAWTKCAMSSSNTTTVQIQRPYWTKCEWLSYETLLRETIM